MSKPGTLYLFPSPIASLGKISSEDGLFLKKAFENDSFEILVEDHKPARRRWVSWGLPREAIDHFILYNEHTSKDIQQELLGKLEKGVNLVLMSDGGLPGFCDPGAPLIFACHAKKIPVRCHAFHNSVMMALVLSGLPHDKFFFAGFPPVKKEERHLFFKKLNGAEETIIVMDTPYRLNQLLEEIAESFSDRIAFLATELGNEDEFSYLLPCFKLPSLFQGEKVKREFILVIGPKNFQGHE